MKTGLSQLEYESFQIIALLCAAAGLELAHAARVLHAHGPLQRFNRKGRPNKFAKGPMRPSQTQKQRASASSPGKSSDFFWDAVVCNVFASREMALHSLAHETCVNSA